MAWCLAGGWSRLGPASPRIARCACVESPPSLRFRSDTKWRTDSRSSASRTLLGPAGWPSVPKPDRRAPRPWLVRRTHSSTGHLLSPSGFRPHLIGAVGRRQATVRQYRRSFATTGSERFEVRIASGMSRCHACRAARRSSRSRSLRLTRRHRRALSVVSCPSWRERARPPLRSSDSPAASDAIPGHPRPEALEHPPVHGIPQGLTDRSP